MVQKTAEEKVGKLKECAKAPIKAVEELGEHGKFEMVLVNVTGVEVLIPSTPVL